MDSLDAKTNYFIQYAQAKKYVNSVWFLKKKWVPSSLSPHYSVTLGNFNCICFQRKQIHRISECLVILPNHVFSTQVSSSVLVRLWSSLCGALDTSLYPEVNIFAFRKLFKALSNVGSTSDPEPQTC